MVKEMNHLERCMASITNQPVDRLTAYPIACGVNRRLLPTPTTYTEWASDPKKFAAGFVAGQSIGLHRAIDAAERAPLALPQRRQPG